MIAAWLAAALAALIVTAVAALLLGWGERLNLLQRLGLCALAAGMAAAAPGRWSAGGVGWGDVLFLAGILAALVGTHGAAAYRRADALDGVLDGRIGRPGSALD